MNTLLFITSEIEMIKLLLTVIGGTATIILLLIGTIIAIIKLANKKS